MIGETTQNAQEQARALMHKLVLMGLGVAALAVILVLFVAA